jgi:linoleoyl-CoA desaturase
MNTVRFTGTDKQEQQFAAALRKNVNNYFKENNISVKANAAMIVKTVILTASYLVPFTLLLTVPMPGWIGLLCAVVMGIGIAGIGMGVMHDACHGAYSRKKWVNDLLAGSLYLLGSNVLNWKIQHNVLHHTYTNISGLDEDIDSKGPVRLAEEAELHRIHKYQFIYVFFFYGLMTLAMLMNDFTRLYNYSKKGLLKSQNKKLYNELVKMLFRKLAYLFVIIGLPLWLTDFSFWQVALGFVIMHWIASIILSFVFQMAHVVEGVDQPKPEPAMPTEWHVHQLKTTSDFAHKNKVLSWYVGGLNFQIEHHLFPGICHIHYKQIAPIVQQTAREYGIVYHLKPTFRSAILSHLYRLKELGKS